MVASLAAVKAEEAEAKAALDVVTVPLVEAGGSHRPAMPTLTLTLSPRPHPHPSPNPNPSPSSLDPDPSPNPNRPDPELDETEGVPSRRLSGYAAPRATTTTRYISSIPPPNLY